MFTLVVLPTLLAVAAAKPSILTSSLVSPTVYAVPATYSTHYGGGLVASPLVSTYSASSIVTSPYAFTTGIHAIRKRSVLPLTYSSVINPAAVSHQSRVDVSSTPFIPGVASPVVSTYATSPFVTSTYGLTGIHAIRKRSLLPFAYSGVASSSVTHQSRVEVHPTPYVSSLVTSPFVSTYAAHPLAAHGIYKRSLVTPFVYSSVVAPAAVSHSARVNIPSARTLLAAPVVSTYFAPLVSTYNTPVIAY